jgi:hypothetical protein
VKFGIYEKSNLKKHYSTETKYLIESLMQGYWETRSLATFPLPTTWIYSLQDPTRAISEEQVYFIQLDSSIELQSLVLKITNEDFQKFSCYSLHRFWFPVAIRQGFSLSSNVLIASQCTVSSTSLLSHPKTLLPHRLPNIVQSNEIIPSKVFFVSIEIQAIYY